MKIGIFGGGFDPVHIGHTFSVQYILDKKYVERIIVIPTYRQPLKEEYSTPFGIRLAMATEAFRKFSEVLVSDIEGSLPLPSYTIYTLKKLKEDYPNDKLFLIIGDDEASNIVKWHRYDELKKYTNFIIIRRYCEEIKYDRTFFKDAIVVDNPVIEISSSLIRELIKEGVRVDGLVPENVLKIIVNERLYT